MRPISTMDFNFQSFKNTFWIQIMILYVARQTFFLIMSLFVTCFKNVIMIFLV